MRPSLPKMWTPIDLLLIIGILAASGSLIVFQMKDPAIPSQVLVEVSGVVAYQYALPAQGSYPLTIEGREAMVLEISEYHTRLIFSDCPFQRCVHHGFLKGPSDAIICVPNETVIRYNTTPVVPGAPWDVMTR